MNYNIKTNMEFDVVINTDDNYIQHCMAMLCSLYENNKEHTITLHVLKKHLSDNCMGEIQRLTNEYNNKCFFYTVDETLLEGVQFRSKRPLSKAAYYRLLLASVLPNEIDKILYLDCDIIVLKDLSEVFNIELNKYALAATLDNFPYTNQHRLQLHMEADERTFCSGIMLVNLKYWRDNDCEPQLLEYAKRYRKEVYLHDQDVLNYLFKKKWFLLPPKWNRVAYAHICKPSPRYRNFDYFEYRRSPMLIHYADPRLKPWLAIRTPYKNEYLKYVRLSGIKPVRFVDPTILEKAKMYFAVIRYFLGELYYNIKYRG